MLDKNSDLDTIVAGMATRNRKRLMGYGILSVILGFIGIYLSTAMTVTTILFMGIFLIIIGIIFLVEAFSAPDWKGKLLSLALSILYVGAGVVTVLNPVSTAICGSRSSLLSS